MKSSYLFDSWRTPIGYDGGARASVRTDDLRQFRFAALLSKNSQRAGISLIKSRVLRNQAGEDNRMWHEWRAARGNIPQTVSGRDVTRFVLFVYWKLSKSAAKRAAVELDLGSAPRRR